MFNHIVIGSNDKERSRKFYDALFAAMGAGPGIVIDKGWLMYAHDGGTLLIATPIDGKPATHANGGTIAFKLTPGQIDAWHAAGVANGGRSCEDPPGVRDQPFGKLYLAYLRDPDNNKLCGIHPLTD